MFGFLARLLRRDVQPEAGDGSLLIEMAEARRRGLRSMGIMTKHSRYLVTASRPRGTTIAVEKIDSDDEPRTTIFGDRWGELKGWGGYSSFVLESDGRVVLQTSQVIRWINRRDFPGEIKLTTRKTA